MHYLFFDPDQFSSNHRLASRIELPKTMRNYMHLSENMKAHPNSKYQR